MYIEFEDGLLTGNKEIDGQHKEWIDRINKLTKAPAFVSLALIALSLISIVPYKFFKVDTNFT